MNQKIVCACIAIFLFSFSCGSSSHVSTLQSEELFTVPIGKMEDQFDFFINNRVPFVASNLIYLDDRLFYIVNGNAAKVMQYSPFGYLMLLLYNPKINPTPILLKKDTPLEDNKVANRKASEYSFIDPGAIAVDKDKNIYIQDRVPEAQYVNENGIMYTNIIEVFSQNGDIKKTKENNEYIIGKEGIGGSPFPYIENMYITARNELVVICRTTRAWHIYWYSAARSLMYEVEIDAQHVPIPKDSVYIPTLEKIVPDYHKPQLYVMVSYSQRVIDEFTGTVATVKNIESRVFELDLTQGKYSGTSIPVPNQEQEEERLFEEKKETDITLYEFLGVSDSGCFFFTKMKDPTTYYLLILNSRGVVIKKSKFQIDDTDLAFINFNLSRQGILSALIVETSQVRVVWWRSDKIIENQNDETG
jgi:hypothetical protein